MSQPCPMAVTLVGSVGREAYWGHNFAALLFGIEASLKGHAALLLDDDFWAGLRGGAAGDTREHTESRTLTLTLTLTPAHATSPARGVISDGSRGISRARWL